MCLRHHLTTQNCDVVIKMSWIVIIYLKKMYKITATSLQGAQRCCHGEDSQAQNTHTVPGKSARKTVQTSRASSSRWLSAQMTDSSREYNKTATREDVRMTLVNMRPLEELYTEKRFEQVSLKNGVAMFLDP